MSVVLHADDFGLNRAINAGVIRGFERGLLTSTALLANAPQAASGIESWKDLSRRHAEGVLPSATSRADLDNPGAPFDLGVHLNLTQGRPLTGPKYPCELLDDRGRFPGILNLFLRLERRPWRFIAGVRAELAAQITFLLDHGLRPSHLNGHQYVEMLPLVAGVVRGLLKTFHIQAIRVAVEPGLLWSTLLRDGRVGPLLLALVKQRFARRFRASFVGTRVAYPRAFFGTSSAGRIDARLMELFLARAPGGELSEIGLHPAAPGYDADRGEILDGWLDPLASLRPGELALLESAELPGKLKARQLKLGRLSQLTTACKSTALLASKRTLCERPARQLSIQA